MGQTGTHFILMACFLLPPTTPLNITPTPTSTSTTKSPKFGFMLIDHCRFDMKSGIRGWSVFCTERNFTHRIPTILTQFSTSITSLTIKYQSGFLYLRAVDVEPFKKLRKFVLTQSGLRWMEGKTFWGCRDLELVDLRGNALRMVDWRWMVGLPRATLDIRHNPFICNCSIFWLAVWKTNVARRRDIQSPNGHTFDLSSAFLMNLPADIVDVDELECNLGSGSGPASSSSPRSISSGGGQSGFPNSGSGSGPASLPDPGSISSIGDRSELQSQIGIQDWAQSNTICSLPTVTISPRFISTVEGVSKSVRFACDIRSAQQLDSKFRDMIQLRIVDANETRANVRLDKQLHQDGLTLNISTENVTRGLMGWYMCTAASDSGPQFDMASLVVRSKPQIRLVSRDVTTSEIGQMIENFQFVIISYPPVRDYVWLKNGGKFEIEDEANAAVFSVKKEDEKSARKKAFFYGERLSLTIQLIFTYEFYQGDYGLHVCNWIGCDRLMFVQYNNRSWFDHQARVDSPGIGPVIIGGQPVPPQSFGTTQLLWVIAVALISCGLAICGIGFIIRRRRLATRAVTRVGKCDSLKLATYTANSIYEPLLSTSVPVVPTASLQIGETLGEGAFGQVYLAYCRLSSSTSSSSKGSTEEEDSASPVAAKRLKQIPASGSDGECSQDFVQEAELMAKLNHPNVVTFYGVCLRGGHDLFLLYEYMDLGDLKRFLATHGPHPELMNAPIDTWRLTPGQQIHIAGQIATGLAYLHQCHIVHRDLAARNCLVKTPLTVKLSDFGMSRDIYFSDYYRLTHNAQLPVRWLPPEALCYGRFCQTSDIWSFGVVLWEIAAYGELPWRGHSNMEVMQKVGAGEILIPPENSPKVLRELMLDCWKRVPSERVKLDDIINRLCSETGQTADDR